MGSKGRIPPPHLRRPIPGPGMLHPDAFGPGLRPPPGPFPHLDMLPPPEIMEQKLAAQHVEMQRLATENQRLAASHVALRQELAAAQHELQILHAQIGAIKSEREQQMRSLTDKVAEMEAELRAADSVKLELQQATAEAQKLTLVRDELMSKIHQMNHDLQRGHADAQQIPALMSELDSLRQEYQHCRATYDFEKKFYNDHLESLQVMEKNYMTMAREVEKLRAELMSTANIDRTVGSYGGTTGNNESGASRPPMGQGGYHDGYGVHQGHGPAAGGANAGSTNVPYVGAQSGPNPTRAGYDASKGLGFDASRAPGYDVQRGHDFNVSKGAAYDAQVRGAAVPHGQAAHPNNMPYRSATPPTRAVSGYEATSRGGNPIRR